MIFRPSFLSHLFATLSQFLGTSPSTRAHTTPRPLDEARSPDAVVEPRVSFDSCARPRANRRGLPGPTARPPDSHRVSVLKKSVSSGEPRARYDRCRCSASACRMPARRAAACPEWSRRPSRGSMRTVSRRTSSGDAPRATRISSPRPDPASVPWRTTPVQ